MTISITANGHGAHEVDSDDIDRAREAAEAVLASRHVTAETAYAAYKAQWIEHDDETPMTGDALIWIEARQAADVALTSTWANPAAECFCDMEA